jgi:uncharacterized protein DUF6588
MNATRRSMLQILSLVCALILFGSAGRAQDPFQDAVKQLSSDNVTGYLQPFVNGLGANLNTGFYNTAQIGDMGVQIRFTIIGMGTLVGDAEKVYSAIPPKPFPQSGVQTATLFGGAGTVVDGPGGTQYQFQSGEVKTSFIPLGVPQLTIGNIFGTQASVRYVPLPSIGDFPKTTLFGIGVRHSISRYIPEFPADLAAGISYDKVTVGDIIDAHGLAFGAQISKSFSVVTVYGGLQYESSSLTVNYTYTGSSPPSTVNLDIDGENKFRVTGGLNLDLVILHLNADVNLGKVTVFSGGIGFGM